MIMLVGRLGLGDMGRQILLFYVKDFWGRRQKETVFYECGRTTATDFGPF